jgi:hypothetical protein
MSREALARPAHPVDPLAAVRGVGGAGEVRDPRVPAVDEVRHRAARGVHVVHVDEARGHAAHLLEQHEGEVAPPELEEVREVGVLVEHGGGDDPVHVLPLEQLHRAALGLVLALRARHDDRVAVLVRVAPRAGDDLAVVRVVDLLDQQPDRTAGARPGGRAPPRGAAGGSSASHRGHDPIARRAPDGAGVVEHGGDGGLGDPGLDGRRR